MAGGVTDRWTPEGRRFKKMLQELSKKEVRVGFQAGKNSEADGTDICDIATWNELGTDSGIPARPFMRNTVDNNGPKIDALFKRAREQVIAGESAEVILNGLGVGVKGLMQEEIKKGSYEPNAPSTIKKKKSDKPLIDTGRMRQSVEYVVKEKGSD